MENTILKDCLILPDAGVFIEEVLNKWKGDYEKLEHNHTYIQWLVTFYLVSFGCAHMCLVKLKL